MTQPVFPWIKIAREYLGVAEIPGASTSGVISGWLRKLKAWWNDDETPWCGTFVGYCLSEAGIVVPKYWMRALAWAEWGRPLLVPRVGAVVVFSRTGGGHVGFVVGIDPSGNLMVLGGNQANKVSIAAFDPARVVSYRWPTEQPLIGIGDLPVLARNGRQLSTEWA